MHTHTCTRACPSSSTLQDKPLPWTSQLHTHRLGSIQGSLLATVSEPALEGAAKVAGMSLYPECLSRDHYATPVNWQSGRVWGTVQTGERGRRKDSWAASFLTSVFRRTVNGGLYSCHRPNCHFDTSCAKFALCFNLGAICKAISIRESSLHSKQSIYI